jgi:hydroxymethylpyrimidine/phosphomethylpyrimidine kinase
MKRSTGIKKGRISSLPFFMRRFPSVPRAVTVAGSDSGGGAGIQADLKTFSVFGVYGMSAVTALTAQNSTGVHGIFAVPPAFVRRQLEAVLSDMGTDGIKTGMLCDAGTVHAVAVCIRKHMKTRLVVDPVMASTEGRPLISKKGIAVLVAELLPLADLVTPNIAEAEILSGMRIGAEADIRLAAERIFRLGCAAVLIKGGHLKGDATDLLFDGKEMTTITAARIATRHTHGTGCTYSAAILSNMILGRTLAESVGIGKRFVTAAIRHAIPLGRGRGTLDRSVKIGPV